MVSAAPEPFWAFECFSVLRPGLSLEGFARVARRLESGGLEEDSFP